MAFERLGSGSETGVDQTGRRKDALSERSQLRSLRVDRLQGRNQESGFGRRCPSVAVNDLPKVIELAGVSEGRMGRPDFLDMRFDFREVLFFHRFLTLCEAQIRR